MTDYTELAGRYIDAWNETDPITRAALVKDLFSANARYTDPMAAAEGPEAITDTIGAVQNQFPRLPLPARRRRHGHHDQVRFTWELGPGSDPAPIVGFDVAVLDPDSKIRTVLGFLDRVPQA